MALHICEKAGITFNSDDIASVSKNEKRILIVFNNNVTMNPNPLPLMYDSVEEADEAFCEINRHLAIYK